MHATLTHLQDRGRLLKQHTYTRPETGHQYVPHKQLGSTTPEKSC